MRRSPEAQSYRAWYSTSRWLRIRAAQLAAEPLCRFCLARGIVTPATVCDHVEPHRGDEARFYGGPFQSLCVDCHDTDKQRIENGGKARAVPDEDGWPMDLP